ncbi:hypothetical protein ACFV4P_25040 [Kitasatospora sp. NPDC059795]|uniref:hypothetical protein n=1 Tax=Kitasatospora sp. NPDC059795 TaxID=3346949 RepID=UPI0036648A93
MNRTENTKEYEVQERAPEALFMREAMEELTDDLTEPVGLTARAMRDGRRRRLRSRLAVGGAAACTAALAVTGLAAVVPGVGSVPGTGVVQMGDAPAPRVFPTVTFSPTTAPPSASPTDSGSYAEQQRIEAFRQATAAALQDLLPPEVGQIRLVADDVSGYLATSPQGGTWFIRFSVSPAPNDTTQRTCRPADTAKGGTCRDEKLPDGTPVVVRVEPESDGSVITDAIFHLDRSAVAVSVSPHERKGSSAPVTADQLTAFVRTPQVLDLIRQADRQPVQEEPKSYDEGENR